MRCAPENLRGFQETILARYRKGARDLPWRHTKDPYAILVSEVMLQQTRVERVIPKYTAFLERFPTPQSLANAPFPDVLGLWQGLGYNNRARRLQEAARALVEHQEPTIEELRALPGVGPYTAAAVAAFARNQDVAAIDVNVRRVFSRYFGTGDDAFIASAVPKGQSRDWHNALMDFGATLCTKRSPGCERCPLSASCHARERGSFSDEPSASQGRFHGTVRWHRGRILKRLLESPSTQEDLQKTVIGEGGDAERFSVALQGLLTDAMVVRDGDRLRIAR